MKNKVLMIFKYPHGWNPHVMKKFSNFYEVESLYMNDLVNKNFTEIVNEINAKIELKKLIL